MADGVLSAVQEKFASLSYDARPSRLWFVDAPLKDVDGSMLDLPIVQFYHENTQAPTTFEYISEEIWRLRFEVYTKTLDSCEAQCNGVLYNQDSPMNVAGLAFTADLAVPSNYQFNALNLISKPIYKRLAIQRTADATAAYQGVFMMDLIVVQI